MELVQELGSGIPWLDPRPPSYSRNFRYNVIDFLKQYGRQVCVPGLKGVSAWLVDLCWQDGPVLLHVYEERVSENMIPVCDQCRNIGWQNHPVSNKRYHFILPNEVTLEDYSQLPAIVEAYSRGRPGAAAEFTAKVLQNRLDSSPAAAFTTPASIFDSTSHYLHGVIHLNGFGHLLRMNGRDGGCTKLTGKQLMTLWDALCTLLGAREVSVEDVSNKNGMLLRVLHAAAYRSSWYGKWGYSFGRAAFGIDAVSYKHSIDAVHKAPLLALLGDYEDVDPIVFSIVRNYSRRGGKTLVSLGQLLQTMLSLIARPSSYDLSLSAQGSDIMTPGLDTLADACTTVSQPGSKRKQVAKAPRTTVTTLHSTDPALASDIPGNLAKTTQVEPFVLTNPNPARYSSARLNQAWRAVSTALKVCLGKWTPRHILRQLALQSMNDNSLVDQIIKSLANTVVDFPGDQKYVVYKAVVQGNRTHFFLMEKYSEEQAGGTQLSQHECGVSSIAAMEQTASVSSLGKADFGKDATASDVSRGPPALAEASPCPPVAQDIGGDSSEREISSTARPGKSDTTVAGTPSSDSLNFRKSRKKGQPHSARNSDPQVQQVQPMDADLGNGNAETDDAVAALLGLSNEQSQDNPEPLLPAVPEGTVSAPNGWATEAGTSVHCRHGCASNCTGNDHIDKLQSNIRKTPVPPKKQWSSLAKDSQHAELKNGIAQVVATSGAELAVTVKHEECETSAPSQEPTACSSKTAVDSFVTEALKEEASSPEPPVPLESLAPEPATSAQNDTSAGHSSATLKSRLLKPMPLAITKVNVKDEPDQSAAYIDCEPPTPLFMSSPVCKKPRSALRTRAACRLSSFPGSTSDTTTTVSGRKRPAEQPSDPTKLSKLGRLSKQLSTSESALADAGNASSRQLSSLPLQYRAKSTEQTPRLLGQGTFDPEAPGVSAVKPGTAVTSCDPDVVRDQVNCDLQYLYNNVLRTYRPAEVVAELAQSNMGTKKVLKLKSFPADIQVLKDVKFFIKDYGGCLRMPLAKTEAVAETDVGFRFVCQLMLERPPEPDLPYKLPKYHKKRKLHLPPPEVVPTSSSTSLEELKHDVQTAFRDVYRMCGKNFRVMDVVVPGSTLLADHIGKHDDGCGAQIYCTGLDTEPKWKHSGGAEDWIVACKCGTLDDDGERMIACDRCSVWMHTRCFGIPDDKDEPGNFLCHFCSKAAGKSRI